MDIGFSGKQFTLSNKRGICQRLWKRLDKAFINDNWLEVISQTSITYFSSTGSDHYPLLMEMTSNEADYINYFKSFYCLVAIPQFLNTLKACWDMNVYCNNMPRFNQKMN